MFWFLKKKLWFEFGESRRPLTYPTPKKALSPANMTVVGKYVPIQYNTAQGTGKTRSGQDNISVEYSQPKPGDDDLVSQVDRQQEITKGQPIPSPLSQLGAQTHKNYTMKIKPVRFSKKVRNNLIRFTRLHPRLHDNFIEEAKRTLAVNANQVAEALKQDLASHIANMKTVYDIFSTLKELDDGIRVKNEEAANLILKGAPPEAIAAVNDEISEMHKARSALVANYVAPLRAQHAKGKQMVGCIRDRINKSLNELELLKSFYCTVCRAIGQLPPDEFKHNRKVEEAAFIKEIFEKEVISAMRMYGLILRKDGTFEVSIINLGKEEDENDNNSKEKIETDS